LDVDVPSFLRELQTPDEMSLVFNPVGFGGRMEPADAAIFQKESIASAVLCAKVPETIRENFERARKLHLYGVLEYEFFTAASDYALLVLEGALRIRFLSYYDNRIPIIRNGKEEMLPAEDFGAVRKVVRSAKLRGSDGVHRLPIGARALLSWARRERLLPGSETQRVDAALSALRNYAAHPDGRYVHGPPDSARTLRDVAEVINASWGHRVSGGRLFPAPVARVPRVAALALNGNGASEMGLQHVPTLDARERESHFGVFLAAVDEKLTQREGDKWVFTYRAGMQRTVFPCEQLWEGNYTQLAEALGNGAFSERGDAIEHLDRLFFICLSGDTLDQVRSPADLLALDPIPPGRWYAIVADSPHQALAHVKNHESDLDAQFLRCKKCFVRIFGRFGDSSAAVSLAHQHGV
jgi:hypothetical protein